MKGNVYPILPFTGDHRHLALRLFALASVIIMTICAVLLFCLPKYRVAPLSVMAGLASGWLTIWIVIKKRGRPLKAAFWQVCALSILILAWDHGTGYRGWSLEFVLPILYICTMVSMSVIVRLLHLRSSDYLLYVVLNILLGMVPLILLLFGKLQVIYPAMICAAVSTVLLTVLILFEGPALKRELLRRLHL